MSKRNKKEAIILMVGGILLMVLGFSYAAISQEFESTKVTKIDLCVDGGGHKILNTECIYESMELISLIKTLPVWAIGLGLIVFLTGMTIRLGD